MEKADQLQNACSIKGFNKFFDCLPPFFKRFALRLYISDAVPICEVSVHASVSQHLTVGERVIGIFAVIMATFDFIPKLFELLSFSGTPEEPFEQLCVLQAFVLVLQHTQILRNFHSFVIR